MTAKKIDHHTTQKEKSFFSYCVCFTSSVTAFQLSPEYVVFTAMWDNSFM